MIYAFDIDGVLTWETQEGVDAYTTRTPNWDAVDLLRELRYGGHVVILWTGRRESRRRITEDWLDLHNVPYDFLFMGKPRFDVFVDDKALTVKQIKEELHDDKMQGMRTEGRLGRERGRDEGPP